MLDCVNYTTLQFLNLSQFMHSFILRNIKMLKKCFIEFSRIAELVMIENSFT